MQDLEGAVRNAARLDAVRRTGLLDSEVEEEFDRLTRLASRLLSAPATFFSLVDADRDFYKSCFGFPEPLSQQREITGVTFCHFSLVSEGALVIPDTRADPLYAAVPTVQSLGVAAYLGVPVRAPSGDVLGSFCAIDFEPRDWSPLDIDVMKELAKSAEREVAIRHWMREQQQLIELERSARVELERVADSRARLMRGFTHDVKNPLGAADGFLGLLVDGIYGTLSPDQYESIRRARGSIDTALKLIGELIEIERADSDQLTIASEFVDLRRTVHDIAEEYRAQAEAKGLELSAAVPSDLPMVCSDGFRIRQVLSNLLSNALKYTETGRVTILAEPRGDSPGDGWIAVVVADTGVGIAERDMPILFDEFTRLDPGQAEGAGLGLAISKRLTDALGGTIAVESRVGGGSTFTLALPIGKRGRGQVPHRTRGHAVA